MHCLTTHTMTYDCTALHRQPWPVGLQQAGSRSDCRHTGKRPVAALKRGRRVSPDTNTASTGSIRTANPTLVRSYCDDVCLARVAAAACVWRHDVAAPPTLPHTPTRALRYPARCCCASWNSSTRTKLVGMHSCVAAPPPPLQGRSLQCAYPAGCNRQLSASRGTRRPQC